MRYILLLLLISFPAYASGLSGGSGTGISLTNSGSLISLPLSVANGGTSSINGAIPNYVNLRVPTQADDSTKGNATGNLWTYGNNTWINQSVSAGFSNWQIQPQISAPLCDRVSGCQGAYGVFRLVTAYVGNAFAVTRSSDSTVKQIPFDVNGIASWSAVDAFCIATTCGVSTWYDQSGNGYDLTQATQANMPQIYGSHVGMQRSITFNGKDTPYWLTNTSLPITSNRAVTVFLVNRQAENASTYMFYYDLGSTTSITGVYSTTGGGQLTIGNTGNAHSSAVAHTLQDSVDILVANGTTDTYIQNNITTSITGADNTASTGVNLGIQTVANKLAGWFDATAFVIYNSTLNATNIQLAQQILYSQVGIQPQSLDEVVVHGDSIAAAVTTTNAPNDTFFVSQYPNQVPHPLNTYAFGYSGFTCNQMQSQVASIYPLVKKTNGLNIVVIECGTNDLAGSDTNANIIGYLTNICTSYRAQGFKCVVSTILPRCAGVPGGFEAQRVAFNTLLASSYTSFSDGINLMGNDPVVGVSATYCTATYSADNIHPTSPVGSAYVAANIATALKPLLQ